MGGRVKDSQTAGKRGSGRSFGWRGAGRWDLMLYAWSSRAFKAITNFVDQERRTKRGMLFPQVAVPVERAVKGDCMLFK